MKCTIESLNAIHKGDNSPFTLKPQWNKSLKPLKQQTLTQQPYTLPTW